MQSIPPSVLTSAELFVLDEIALELQNPRLTSERRSELTVAIDKIAARYAWDFRLTDGCVRSFASPRLYGLVT